MSTGRGGGGGGRAHPQHQQLPAGPPTGAPRAHLSAGGSVYVLDRSLLARVAQHERDGGDLSDPAAVALALRARHRDLQRKSSASLKHQVARAVLALRQEREEDEAALRRAEVRATGGGVGDDNDGREEALEAAMRGGGSGGGGGSDGNGSSDSGSTEGSDSGSDSDSDADSDADLEAERAAALNKAGGPGGGGMNGALMGLYGGRNKGGDDAGAAAADKEEAEAEPPAFASPELVAAAARRALATEAAAADKDKVVAGTAAAAVVPRTPAAAAMAAAAPAPAPSASAKPRARSAEEAGLSAAAAAGGPAAGKRLRRLAGAGGGGGGNGANSGGGPPHRPPNNGGNGGGGGAASTAQFVSAAAAPPRSVRFSDLGGVDDALRAVRELVLRPLAHPEVYSWLGVPPPRGVLLHGPPGCGKTMLAHAVATEAGVPFLRIAAPEIVSGVSGESEQRLRALFAEAAALAPCILFVDEVDAIAPRRESAQREMERRIVAQMLACMDELGRGGQEEGEGAAGAEGAEGTEAAAAAVARRARPHVVVIGATNRPDALDPALRRAGRFDREIALGIPTEAARAQILRALTRGLRLAEGLDVARIARRTPGFVGADLAALATEAAASAVGRIFAELDAESKAAEAAVVVADKMEEQVGTGGEASGGAAAAAAPAAAAAAVDAAASASAAAALAVGLPLTTTAAPPPAPDPAADPLLATPILAREPPLPPHRLASLAITMADFELAVGKVQPSVRREGFSTKPGVTWDDVGALAGVREELAFAVTQPIAHPERFAALGLGAGAGVLLYGPPGCGKTLVAKAAAAESGANFVSIKGPELLNKYVGESERAVRSLFARARAAKPCVLFFDELDALAPRRGGGGDGNAAGERLVNQLLTEMDGVEGRDGVFVVAATNRPDMVDPALLRPGRLDKSLYVPLPPPEDRAAVLRAAARRTPCEPGALEAGEAVARSSACDGFSGADVAAVVREAAVLALKESLGGLGSAGLGRGLGEGGGGAVVAGAAQAPAPAPAPPADVRVAARHFEAAARRVVPSVSPRDRRAYEALRHRLAASRGHIGVDEDAADKQRAGVAGASGGGGGIWGEQAAAGGGGDAAA